LLFSSVYWGVAQKGAKIRFESEETIYGALENRLGSLEKWTRDEKRTHFKGLEKKNVVVSRLIDAQ
jgi:hypothetical protein